MQFIRFKHKDDELRWFREFGRKGELTMLRGSIYQLREPQYKELEEAGVEMTILSLEEVNRFQSGLQRQTA